MKKEQLKEQINLKQDEIRDLENKYFELVEQEKKAVLKAKSEGMKKSLYLLGFEFESSSGRTSQYLEFHRTFKREFKKLLQPYTKKIDISKPNHFDLSGFFELNSGDIYYISVGDLRWSKDNMLIRTAKDFKDYTGGSNGFISLNSDFESNLQNYLKLG